MKLIIYSAKAIGFIDPIYLYNDQLDISLSYFFFIIDL